MMPARDLQPIVNSGRRSVAALLLLLLGACASLRHTPVEEDVSLWGRWERVFEAETDARAVDTELTVTLVGPDGTERIVDGFWNGGREWRVRFIPDQVGRWTYRTSSLPDVAGLNGRTGRFEVTEGAAEGPFARHGAVVTRPGERHLEHADGTPFFWLGDTGWNGALKSTSAGWDRYLTDRSDKGFSVIQLVTTQWRASDTDADGAVAYSGYDSIRINPAFFARMDARIDAVNASGMLAAPVLLWALGDSLTSPGRLPEDQAIRLARYLVARYQGNHVVWILGGDENYGRTAERWKRIGRGVFRHPGHAPVTLHPQGMQWSFDRFAGESWLGLMIYQSGHGDDESTLRWIYSGPPTTAWRSGRAMPILNSEPPYEDHIAYQSGERHTAYNVRRAAYWSLLSVPPAGVTYGAHGVWSWEEEPAVPLRHENSGVARPWHEAMALPGSDDMQRLGELFRSLEWWRLRPAPELVTQISKATRDHVAAAATEAGDLAILYLPTGGTVQVVDERFRRGAQAEWFDPRSGLRRPASGTGAALYSAPDSLDWLLVLTRAGE